MTTSGLPCAASGSVPAVAPLPLLVLTFIAAIGVLHAVAAQVVTEIFHRVVRI